ncbi:MAG TPA: hypothetical protein VEF05_12580 [Terriglobales bacterium]|nr:hypothetical protein [Terriglobales bacterium]
MSAMSIIWRNPKQVRHHLRWSQQAQIGNRTVYIVEQLLSAESNVWANASVLEVIPGQVPAPHAEPRRWRLRLGW